MINAEEAARSSEDARHQLSLSDDYAKAVNSAEEIIVKAAGEGLNHASVFVFKPVLARLVADTLEVNGYKCRLMKTGEIIIRW